MGWGYHGLGLKVGVQYRSNPAVRPNMIYDIYNVYIMYDVCGSKPANRTCMENWAFWTTLTERTLESSHEGVDKIVIVIM